MKNLIIKLSIVIILGSLPMIVYLNTIAEESNFFTFMIFSLLVPFLSAIVSGIFIGNSSIPKKSKQLTILISGLVIHILSMFTALIFSSNDLMEKIMSNTTVSKSFELSMNESKGFNIGEFLINYLITVVFVFIGYYLVSIFKKLFKRE